MKRDSSVPGGEAGRPSQGRTRDPWGAPGHLVVAGSRSAMHRRPSGCHSHCGLGKLGTRGMTLLGSTLDSRSSPDPRGLMLQLVPGGHQKCVILPPSLRSMAFTSSSNGFGLLIHWGRCLECVPESGVVLEVH